MKMPNWCSNEVIISGDKEEIKKLKDKAFKKNKDGAEIFQFNNLIPRPKKEEKNWYNWNINNWGTKWDVEATSHYEDETSLEMEFDTAWGPPAGVFYQIKNESPSLQISWFYHEPMMELAGYLQDE
jgi:hypothetical protein